MFSTGARKTRRSLVLALVFAVALLHCRREPPSKPTTVRIVSIAPSTTEAIYALGLGSSLVGRSTFCDEPPEVLALPSVGGFADPSLEKIVALSPLLVVGVENSGSSKTLAAALDRLEIRTAFEPANSALEVEHMLLHLGEVLDQRDAGKNAAARFRADLEVAKKEAMALWLNQDRPTIAMVLEWDPLMIVGNRGFLSEMVAFAGLRNAVVAEGDYPTVNVEQLMRVQPDVVIDASGMSSTNRNTRIASEPWISVQAIRTGALVEVRDASILRPGPRMPQGIRRLAEDVKRAYPH